MNISTNTVSVIIPVYNQEIYIGRCLRSLLDQSLNKNNYEIIKISLANRWGAEIELKKEEQLVFFEQIKPKNNNSNFSKLIEIAKDKLGPNIILKTILKKNDDSSFQIPLQGKYLEDIKSFDLDYSDQKNGSADALGQILDSAKRNK